MLRLFFFSILSAAYCSCPSGFDLVSEGQCRGKYVDVPNTSYGEATSVAISKCAEIQGQPIIIHTEEQQTYWSAQANKTINMVLGMVCNTTTKKWEWSDGSAVDFKPRTHTSDLDQPCKTGCLWLIYDPAHTSSWQALCSFTGTTTARIGCSAQTQIPTPSADGCESFADDGEDGVCYQIGATAENWQDAQKICREFGADLASVHNIQENSFIRRLAVSKGEVNGLFLGATIAGKGNDFGWIDASAWDYDNFYSGFPMNGLGPGFPMNGLGDCVAMDTQGTGGEWVNTNCSSKLSVACIRQQMSMTVCSPGPWKEENLIASPGFPYDASIPCDFMLTVAAGKKVQLEVFVLEANSCCDHLVLFDNYIGGNVIANLTNEISNKVYTSKTNFMRATWQPNGGVNVRGVMMTYRAV